LKNCLLIIIIKKMDICHGEERSKPAPHFHEGRLCKSEKSNLSSQDGQASTPVHLVKRRK
jgi:hypothetical protein